MADTTESAWKVYYTYLGWFPIELVTIKLDLVSD